MKKLFFLLLLPVMACQTLPEMATINQQQADHFLNKVHALQQSPMQQDSLQSRFFEARLAFKSFELWPNYYLPEAVKKVNGPVLPKVDEHDANRKTLHPTGFQVVEEYLFPFHPADSSIVREKINELYSYAQGLCRQAKYIQFTEAHFFQAFREQILTYTALGLSNFDSPVAKHSHQEMIASLEGVKPYLHHFHLQSTTIYYINALQRALRIDGYSSYHLIKKYFIPLERSLNNLRKTNQVKALSFNQMMPPWEQSLFKLQQFNPHYFSLHPLKRKIPASAELGEQLFFDPQLSGNGQRSCASCHQTNHAFASTKARDLAIGQQKPLPRNTPSLNYAAFQSLQFWDGRAGKLEDQIRQVISNPEEMNSSLAMVSEKLNTQASYQKYFEEAFGPTPSISPLQIQTALADYIRSIPVGQSAFDQMLFSKLPDNPQVAHGFDLFMGKAQCGTCHFFPLFNGTVPPHFTETETEVLGITATENFREPTLDPDAGKYHLYQADLHLFAFKTPTVRNSALTAPYMHNGAFSSLEKVLEFYDAGGGAGLGLNIPHQTLPADSLHLSQNEKDALIAFLAALNDQPAEQQGLIPFVTMEAEQD
ncbi:cytochrome-c peroxidase [Persicobacter psychrovividus]